MVGICKNIIIMRIKRQKQFSFGSKALAVVSPGAWNAKELCKLQSADEKEYKKNRFKMAAKGFFAPWSARNKLKKAQDLYRQGADSETIKQNTELTTERALVGATIGKPVRKIGNALSAVRGLRTKFGNNLKNTRVNFNENNNNINNIGNNNSVTY